MTYDALTPRARAMMFYIKCGQFHHATDDVKDTALFIDNLEALIIEAQNNQIQKARSAIHQHEEPIMYRKDAARIVAGFRIDNAS